MKLAILADIHGNLPALEAILDDLERERPDQVYLVGDLVNRCPWSNEVLAILRDKNWPSVQGNHDLTVGVLDKDNPYPPFDNRARFPDLWWTLAHMHEADRAYLRNLPPELTIAHPNLPAIRVVHGVPGDPFVGFEANAPAVNRAKAANVTEPIIIAGHTHRPMWEYMDNLQILNPGGVGISHNGDPRAHYLLLHGQSAHTKSSRWEPEFRVLDYDRAAVAHAFHESGFMEFAGPMGELHFRTVMSGHAWASDFNYWMRDQPPEIHADIDQAVRAYLAAFPDERRWAFPYGEI